MEGGAEEAGVEAAAHRSRGPGRPPTSPEHRAELRLRIARAALDLFVERGYEQTRVADVAERAGVSSRTLWRQFDSKAACLLPLATDTLGAGIVTVVRAWPPSVPLLQFFAGLTPIPRPEPISRTSARFMRLIRDEPGLDALVMRATRQVERDIAAALAERDGTPADGLVGRSRAAVIFAAFRSALEFVAATDEEPDDAAVLSAARAALECVAL